MSPSPDSGPTMRAEKVDAIEAMLREAVRDSPRAESQVRRRRIALISALAGSLVLVGTTAGAVLLQNQSVSDQTIVHCASSAEIGANGEPPGSAIAVSAPGSQAARIDDAIDACEAMWRQGALEPGFDPNNASNTPGAVPDDLTVCVLPDQSAAVIPGKAGICNAIGLAALQP